MGCLFIYSSSFPKRDWIKFMLRLTGIITFTAMTYFSMVEIEKETAIKHLNNKPVYEKIYMVDTYGNTVDSTYVKLNN